MSTSSHPSNWPSHVRFITKPVYHASVLPATRDFIRSARSSSTQAQANVPCKAQIRKIVSPTHPAFGQSGLFAGKKIPAGAHIIDYMGEIHCDDRPNSDYDLSLHRFADGTSVGIDASTMGNEARFINDFRGVKKKPNAVFSDYRTSSGELRMCIRSCDEIKKGDEILVSYGKSWWGNRKNDYGYNVI